MSRIFFFTPSPNASTRGHSINPRPAGVFGRTRPAGGGRADSAPCLTPERMVVERRENGKRKLSTRQILRTPKILLKEVRGQVKGQVKGQNYRVPQYWLPSPTGAALIGLFTQNASRG